MSYRDLRNFTEMMKALGYKRLISMENFRSPNFKLVAEVLIWLIHRYDPKSNVPKDIDSEQDRVFFIKAAAQFMATKAHIKLNTKKLYQADGYAVKELLKATSVLYSASKSTAAAEKDSVHDSTSNSIALDISSRIGDLKETRRLASDITTKGAKLHELLGKEVDLREERNLVLAKSIDVPNVEKNLSSAIKKVENEIEKTVENINNVASDEANLEAKIEKKKAELERNNKRLSTLQHVRPAYMDDYERLETELSSLYSQYILKYRNLKFLEQQMDEYTKAENEKFESTENDLKAMAEKMKSFQSAAGDDGDLRDLVDEDDDADYDDDGMGGGVRRKFRGLGGGRGDRAAAGGGGMNLDDDDEDDDDDDDEDEDDSDVDLDEDDDGIGDDDDDDIELGASAGATGGGGFGGRGGPGHMGGGPMGGSGRAGGRPSGSRPQQRPPPQAAAARRGATPEESDDDDF